MSNSVFMNVSKKKLNNKKLLLTSTIAMAGLSILVISQGVAAIGNNSKGNSSDNAVPRIFDKGYTCSHLMYDYGVTSSAQAHCGFSKYNGKIVTIATQCVDYAKKGGQGDAIENILVTGIEDFNELMANADNKEGVCASVLQNYSEFVSR